MTTPQQSTQGRGSEMKKAFSILQFQVEKLSKITLPLRDVKDHLDTFEERLSSLSDSFDHLSTQYEVDHNEIENLKKMLSSNEQTVEDSPSIRQQVEELSSKNSFTSQRLNQLGHDVKELSSNVSTNKQDIMQVQDHESRSFQLSQLNSEVEKLKSGLISCQSKASQRLSEIEEIRLQASQLKQEHSLLEMRIKQCENNGISLRDSQQKVSDLLSSFEDMQQTLTSTSEKQQSLSSKLDQVIRLNAGRDTQVEQLGINVREAHQKCRNQENRISRLWRDMGDRIELQIEQQIKDSSRVLKGSLHDVDTKLQRAIDQIARKQNATELSDHHSRIKMIESQMAASQIHTFPEPALPPPSFSENTIDPVTSTLPYDVQNSRVVDALDKSLTSLRALVKSVQSGANETEHTFQQDELNSVHNPHLSNTSSLNMASLF